VETASAARHDKPKLAKLRAQLKANDVLVTFKLDRLARSPHHLLTVLKDLDERQIGFETIDAVSTRGSTRRLTLNVLGARRPVRKGTAARAHNGRACSRPIRRPCGRVAVAAGTGTAPQ
jgi:DNA invertase Pin-like site-specific DNA recombinase